MAKHNKTITLRCPTCGSTSFEHEEGDFKTANCSNCRSEFSKQGLIDANQNLINAEAKKLGRSIVKDLIKGFKI